jgi:hypothetical protein
MGTFCTTTALDILMPGTTFNTATTAIADKCITQAENHIRKYLSKRYDVSGAAFQTSTSVPPVVTTMCEEMAMGHMYMYVGRGTTGDITRAKALIEHSKKCLMDIVENDGDLVDSSGDTISERTNRMAIKSNTVDYIDTFAEDSPLNWTIDDDKLDDISDDRDW